MTGHIETDMDFSGRFKDRPLTGPQRRRRASLFQHFELHAGVTFLDGLPGTGKSRMALQTCLAYLVARPEMHLHTNLALYPAAIARAVGDDVARRVHLFKDPCPNVRNEPISTDWESDGVLQQITTSGEVGDCVVLIDECRRWFAYPQSRTPEWLSELLDTVRHRGVYVVAVCPDVKKIASAIRRNAAAYVHLTHGEKKRLIWFLPPLPIPWLEWSEGVDVPPSSSHAWHPLQWIKTVYATTGGTIGYEPERRASRVEVDDSARRRLAMMWRFVGGVSLMLALGVFFGYRSLRDLRWLRKGSGKPVEVVSASLPTESPLRTAAAGWRDAGIELPPDALLAGLVGDSSVREWAGRLWVEVEPGSGRYVPARLDEFGNPVFDSDALPSGAVAPGAPSAVARPRASASAPRFGVPRSSNTGGQDTKNDRLRSSFALRVTAPAPPTPTPSVVPTPCPDCPRDVRLRVREHSRVLQSGRFSLMYAPEWGAFYGRDDALLLATAWLEGAEAAEAEVDPSLMASWVYDRQGTPDGPEVGEGI